jgi:hypothetical protein
MIGITTTRHTIRVKEGRDITRAEEGTGYGQFTMEPYGVKYYGKNGLWTLIPWTNVLMIEPVN